MSILDLFYERFANKNDIARLRKRLDLSEDEATALYKTLKQGNPPNRNYLPYIIGWYLNGSINRDALEHDIGLVRKALEQFHDNKHKLKEISKYSDFHDLLVDIEAITEREQIKSANVAKSEVDEEGNTIELIPIPDFNTMRELCGDIGWCISSSKKLFDEYSANGLIFLITKNGQPSTAVVNKRYNMDRGLEIVDTTNQPLSTEQREKYRNLLEMAYAYWHPEYDEQMSHQAFETEVMGSRKYLSPSNIENIKRNPVMALMATNGSRAVYAPELENTIAQEPSTALEYASNNLGSLSRFPKGEKAIASQPMTAYAYALHIGNRFELGEPAIAKHTDLMASYSDMFDVEFPNQEQRSREFINNNINAIAESDDLFRAFSNFFIKRKLDIPNLLMEVANKNPNYAFYMQRSILQNDGKVIPELIDCVIKSDDGADMAYFLQRLILEKGGAIDERLIELLSKDPYNSIDMQELILENGGQINEKLIDKLSKNADSAFSVQKVILKKGGPIIDSLIDAISKNAKHSIGMQKLIFENGGQLNKKLFDGIVHSNKSHAYEMQKLIFENGGEISEELVNCALSGGPFSAYDMQKLILQNGGQIDERLFNIIIKNSNHACDMQRLIFKSGGQLDNRLLDIASKEPAYALEMQALIIQNGGQFDDRLINKANENPYYAMRMQSLIDQYGSNIGNQNKRVQEESSIDLFNDENDNENNSENDGDSRTAMSIVNLFYKRKAQTNLRPELQAIMEAFGGIDQSRAMQIAYDLVALPIDQVNSLPPEYQGIWEQAHSLLGHLQYGNTLP